MTLAITRDAADAIRRLTADPILDGVRISLAGAAQNGSGPDLRVALVPGPDDSDLVADAEGARVYVQPAALQMLGDAVLDADVVGGEVRFALLERDEEG